MRTDAGTAVYAPKVPIDAEARGKLRQWRRLLATNYAAIDSIIRSIKQPVVEDFMFKSGKGRRRVFDRLNAQLCRHGAQLQALRLDGKQPLALWAVLKPRRAVTVNALEQRDEQPCVCLNYLLIGATPIEPAGCMQEGLWSLELTEHALGRWLQRSNNDNLDAAIFAAHHAALNVDMREWLADPERTTFALRQGADVWKGDIRIGADVSFGGMFTMHLVVRTYLAFDQLSPDQEFGLIVPRPLARDSRLGEGWLQPPPFCYIEVDGDRATGTYWPDAPPLLALTPGQKSPN